MIKTYKILFLKETIVDSVHFDLYFFKFGTRTVILMHSQSSGVNEVSIELGQ